MGKKTDILVLGGGPVSNTSLFNQRADSLPACFSSPGCLQQNAG